MICSTLVVVICTDCTLYASVVIGAATKLLSLVALKTGNIIHAVKKLDTVDIRSPVVFDRRYFVFAKTNRILLTLETVVNLGASEQIISTRWTDLAGFIYRKSLASSTGSYIYRYKLVY